MNAFMILKKFVEHKKMKKKIKSRMDPLPNKKTSKIWLNPYMVETSCSNI